MFVGSEDSVLVKKVSLRHAVFFYCPARVVVGFSTCGNANEMYSPE
jgi:hypothetical protein